jgi:hypothetical protein
MSNETPTAKYKIRIPGPESIKTLTPEAEDNIIPLIASQPKEDTANEPKGTNLVTGNKLPASFEALKRNGFKFTSFTSSINSEGF